MGKAPKETLEVVTWFNFIFSFYYLNITNVIRLHFLNTKVFSLSFSLFSLPVPLGKGVQWGVSEQPRLCSAESWGQPTTTV